MKTSEVKKLKITALNIRSVLTEKNKRIAKLERKKIRLVRRQGLQAERATAERNLETKSNKKSPIRSVLSSVSNAVMSPLMKVVNFFIFTLLGAVAKDFPKIISGLKKTWKVVKATLSILWKTIKFIINPIWELGKLVSKLFKPKSKEKNPNDQQDKTQTSNDSVAPLTADEATKAPDLTGDVEDTSESITPDTGEESDTDSSSSGPAAASPPPSSLTNINPSKVMDSVTEDGGVNNESKNIENVGKRVKIAKKNITSKVKKVKDLNGNIDDLDVKTIIVPVERNTVVSTGGQNNSTMGLSSPPPPMVTSKRR